MRWKVSDDAARRIGNVNVSGNRRGGLEVQVTLNRQAELAAQTGDFRKADGAVFGEAKAKVAQAPKDVLVVRVNRGNEPGAVRIRREQLHNRPRVEVVADFSAPEAVTLQRFDVLGKQEFQGRVFR